MNNRIWELFRQAHHPHPKHGGDDMFFPEEFAELIIRECASVVERDMDRAEPIWCSDKILKHFGVE